MRIIAVDYTINWSNSSKKLLLRSKIVLVYTTQLNYIFFFFFGFLRPKESLLLLLLVTCSLLFFSFLFCFVLFLNIHLLPTIMSTDHFLVSGERDPHSSDPASYTRGIPNVSARPRINLPGRSDRVVKHSHHVSFALITKNLLLSFLIFAYFHRSFILSFSLSLSLSLPLSRITHSLVLSPHPLLLFDLN